MNHESERWQISSLGVEQLVRVREAIPSPAHGEVLVRVEAISLNFRDREVLDHGMGVPLSFPFTPCSDMAGRVVELGEGTTRLKVDDRVVSVFIPGWSDGQPKSWTEAPTQGGPINGLLARYVTLPEDWLVKAPGTVDAVQASTLPVAGVTAWMALVELGHLRAGQAVVVQGTGGVSLFAIQLVALHGAEAIVTTTSEDKMARVKALGARHAINRVIHPEWHSKVLELTRYRGAEHILEMAGGNNLKKSLLAVSNGGRISVIGLLESAETSIPVLPLLGSRASIVGISVGPRRVLEDLIGAIDVHGLKPVVEHVYPFAEAKQAFEHVARGPFGKIVIDVS